MYEYACQVTRIIDGDTVAVKLDLGFLLWFHATVRLAGLQAPELKTGEPGARSKAMLADLLLDKPGVIVVTSKGKEFEKYGRVLGTFHVGAVNVNQAMIDGGYAVKSAG
jgi:micrococcal nuclease